MLVNRPWVRPGVICASILVVGAAVAIVAYAALLKVRDAPVRINTSPSLPGVADAAAPLAQLTTSTVAQGGALAVEIHSDTVSAAQARFQGRVFPMVDASGLWFAVLGVGQAVGSANVLPAGQYSVDVDYQIRGSKAVKTDTLPLTVQAVQFPTDDIRVSAQLLQLVAPELEAEEAQVLIGAYSAFTPTQYWQGPFDQPVDGEVTTVFAARRAYNGGPATGSHEGIDIAVPMGTPVHASANGKVAWTGQLPDRGQGVIIDHGLGIFTGYFHLSEIDSQPGQAVNKGDVIGLAGSTGFSTGPHVHWEVVIDETNVDGLLFKQLNLP
jgi:murein DD-endopeptidase MepM/ murein hydrolase activator NlpD